MAKRLAPVHPGEVLLEEFLEPMALSQYRLAKDIHVPPRRISTRSVHGTRGVSADTALRLARYLGTSERFWLNLQAQFDLDIESDRVGDQDRARDRSTRGLTLASSVRHRYTVGQLRASDALELHDGGIGVCRLPSRGVVEPPALRYAFELVNAGVFQDEATSGGEIFDGLAY